MRRAAAITMATLFVLCASLTAADAAPAKPVGDEKTLIGTVGAKPTTAPADIVAVFYSSMTNYKLMATGDVAAKLELCAKKIAKVKLTGTVKDDTITVSQVTSLDSSVDNNPPKDKKKDRNKDKGDKPGKNKDKAN
jgi:hypothetical protein